MSDDNMQDALADDWAAALAAQTEASQPAAAAVFPPKGTGSSANVSFPSSTALMMSSCSGRK